MNTQQNPNSNQNNFPGFSGFFTPFTFVFHSPQEQTQANDQNNSNNANGVPQNQSSDNNTNTAPQPSNMLNFIISFQTDANGEGNNQPPSPFILFFAPLFFPTQPEVHKHLSDAAMKELPIITITQDHINTKANCPICLEEFSLTKVTKDQTQSPQIRQMPCKHIFCEACIFKWLKQNNTCPLCRYEIEVDDQQQSQNSSENEPAQNNSENEPSQNNSENETITDHIMIDTTLESLNSTNSQQQHQQLHHHVSCELAHVGCCGELQNDPHRRSPIITLPRCHHRFHASCLRTSLIIEGYSTDSSASLDIFCPTCRAPAVIQPDILKIIDSNSDMLFENNVTRPYPMVEPDEMDLD